MDPIEPGDLPDPRELTKTFFRATSPHIGHAAFERKWKRAVRSPLRLFRSFPPAYWLVLERVPAGHVPGRPGLCHGDPHLENFGLIRSAAGSWVFVANDLDDAGIGEVGLDAVRWAVSLLLAGEKWRRVERLLEGYVAVVGGAPAPTLPAELVPDVGAVVAGALEKLVAGHELVRGEGSELVAIDRRARALVERAFESGPLGSLALLDVAERIRVEGGSGGLRRFWALVARGTGKKREIDVLELKELTRPAVEWGHHRTPLADRIAEVSEHLFAGVTMRDHFAVRLGHAEFLVRSRLGRASIDLDALDAPEREAVLAAQAGLLARDHRAAQRDVDTAALLDWLVTSTRTVAEFWEEVAARVG